MDKCEEPCENCTCEKEEEDDGKEPQGDPLPLPISPSGQLAVDEENADFYAFSNTSLRQLRESAVSQREEGGVAGATKSPLDWDLSSIALQIIGNKLDGKAHN